MASADHWLTGVGCESEVLDLAYLGERPQSRDSNAKGSYRWYVERQEDPFGHSIAYEYRADRGRKYLQNIRHQLYAVPQEQNRVAFSYESRPDAFTDYTYGYAETTALRLQSIDVRPAAPAALRPGLRGRSRRPQLASVDEAGEYGLHKPRLKLA